MARTYTPTQFSTEVSTFDVDLPATINAGDRLILFLGTARGYGSVTSAPTGWTLLESDEFFNVGLVIYERIADGTEGATVSIGTSESRRGAAMVVRDDAAHASQAVESALTIQTSNATSFDPPSLTASWGAEATNVWLTGAVTGPDEADNFIDSYPANYSAGSTEIVRSRDVDGSGSDCVLFVSERVANVATENPGVFDTNPTRAEVSIAFTIALRGAAAVADPTIDQTTLPDGEVDVAYSQTLTVTDGGTPAATPWTISAGSLPSGWSIDASTGEISGTATTAGDYTFTVQYERDDAVTATQEYTVTVTADLDGNVTLDGSADDGALVLVLDVATDPVTEVARKTTDASGNYYVGGLTAGDYVVVVEASDGSTADGGMVTVT